MTDEENFDDAAKRRAEGLAPGEGAGAKPQSQPPEPAAEPEEQKAQSSPHENIAETGNTAPGQSPAAQNASNAQPSAEPSAVDPAVPQGTNEQPDTKPGPFPPQGPAMGERPGPYAAPDPRTHPQTGQIPMVQPPMGGPPPANPPTQQYPPQAKPMSGGAKAVLALAMAAILALGAGLVGGLVGYSLAGSSGSAQSSPSQLTSDSTLTEVAAAVQPSVVSVSAGEAEGSGVVYNDDGYIITNNHVVAGAQNGRIEVAFANGDSATADVVGTDPAGDLAVLKVKGVSGLQPIEFGDSDGLAVGDTVLALGSPLGLDGSVSSGIVSALDRTIQAGGEQGQGGSETATLNGLIQTDAAINPGNSGGALVNGNGELIGINTAIATTGDSQGSVGVGFAIPSSTVEPTVKELIENGGVERGFLGVSVTDAVGGESQGAIVTTVQKGSPADKAGIGRGDIITSIDGNEVSSASDVVSAVQSAKPGSKVQVEFVSDSGDKESVDVTLGGTTD